MELKQSLVCSRQNILFNEALFFKRLIDVVVGFIALLICMPILITIAVVVRLDSKGNPIFTQLRVGRHGRTFRIFKIRTLYIEHFGIFADQNEPSAYRITRLGKYLRRSKLDELPQLLNIVLGQMSFVGPRPIAYDYFKLVETPPERLLVKPGLTGLTQVRGNLLLPWEERMQLDKWYGIHWSFRMDFKILIATCFTVLHGEQLHNDYVRLHQQGQ